jgi:hypothetical protein
MQTAEASKDCARVPGIYEHCDQWCSYCAATARCLAFRRMQERQEQRGTPFGSLEEVIEFTREVKAEEGSLTPELDVLLSPDPVTRMAVMPEIDDPLDDLAYRYVFEAHRFLERRNWIPPMQVSPQPSPLDVVAWYHLLIGTRIGRALASEIQAARGRGAWMEDASGCAKMVLVGIERSHRALRKLRGQRDDARVVALLETLEELGPAVERRFPAARAFIRPGLDGPVA